MRKRKMIPEFYVWVQMLQRDKRKTGVYKNVTVCKRWKKSFENFIADMGRRPSDRHSLDRYPNNKGNYKPSNCRWATWTEQNNNRTNNRLITYEGRTLNITQWSHEKWLSINLIRRRLIQGLPVNRIFAAPRRWKSRF